MCHVRRRSSPAMTELSDATESRRELRACAWPLKPDPAEGRRDIELRFSSGFNKEGVGGIGMESRRAATEEE